MQPYLPGGGARSLEMPPDLMLPRHARLSRVLETRGINIVLLKTGQPFQWDEISGLDIAYYRIFEQFRTSKSLSFYESRQEWFGWLHLPTTRCSRERERERESTPAALLLCLC